jgi:hypothetical protein
MCVGSHLAVYRKSSECSYLRPDGVSMTYSYSHSKEWITGVNDGLKHVVAEHALKSSRGWMGQ